MRSQDENQPSCPIELAVAIIGNKWAIPILRELFTGPKRPSFFLKSLKGISPKTLTERLREMEANGLVRRTVHATIPPCVEYSLTPMGSEVRELMLVLKNLGAKWSGNSKPTGCSESAFEMCSECLVDLTDQSCPLRVSPVASTSKGKPATKTRSLRNVDGD
jgi:DNA-binding HxlR family transcriptional regulator